MSSGNKLKSLIVYDDHVVYDNNQKNIHPLIEGLSLQAFAKFAINSTSYSSYLLQAQQIKKVLRSDTDSPVFEDYHDFYYDYNEHKNNSFLRPTISILFKSTNNENYDYTASRRRDSSTAYKRGPTHPLRKKKFVIARATIFRDDGNADVWVQAELTRIQSIMNKLDKDTHTLESWAESGLSMRVMCSRAFCFHSSTIPPEQIGIYVNKGLSIEEIKAKLLCKNCGAHAPILSPALD